MLKEILLVDDSQATNILNKRLLMSMGVVELISIALNGKEALDYLTTKKADGTAPAPEIIILDINMPVMDGFQFLEKYQELPPSLKAKLVVVMLTSSVNSSDSTKANSFKDIIEFAEKPLTKELILGVIDRLV